MAQRLPTEATVNHTLAILRKLTSKETVRNDANGRLVADLVFSKAVRSLDRLVPPGTINMHTLKLCVSVLVAAGFIAPGKRGVQVTPRWVRMEDEFRYVETSA